MLEIWCDGCCDPNPGGVMAWAFVAHDTPDGVTHAVHVADQRGSLPAQAGATNNVCEYGAVIKALEWLRTRPVQEATIYSDSQLVIGHITGARECGSDHLAKLLAKVQRLSEGLTLTWQWVPRTQNCEADLLSRWAYQQRTGRLPTDWTSVKAQHTVTGKVAGRIGG